MFSVKCGIFLNLCVFSLLCLFTFFHHSLVFILYKNQLKYTHITHTTANGIPIKKKKETKRGKIQSETIFNNLIKEEDEEKVRQRQHYLV